MEKSKCSDSDVLYKIGADTVVVTLRRRRFGLLVRLIKRKAWEVIVPAMLAKAPKGRGCGPLMPTWRGLPRAPWH